MRAIHTLPALALSACCAAMAAPVSADKIASERSGHGPVVVFQAGLGDNKQTWQPLLPQLDQRFTLFRYDRPGYGNSAAVAGPRDPCTLAEELHTLLQRQGLKPPYLLVGHSIGSLYQLVYARRYPHEVAGLVLIDPTHPQHWLDMQGKGSAEAGLLKTLKALALTPTEKREFEDMGRCLHGLALTRPPAKPVQLLFRTQFAPVAHSAFAQLASTEQRDWVRWTAGQAHWIAGAGHHIHRDRPDAIRQALDALLRQQ